MARDRDVWEVEPLYSTVRLACDFTPGVAPALGAGFWDSAFVTDQQRAQRELLAFSYGQGDGANSMQKAGFGNRTAPRFDHTNLEKAGIVPKNGMMLVTCIGIIPSPLYRPAGSTANPASTDPNVLVDDSAGAQLMPPDSLFGALAPSGGAGGQLRATMLKMFARSWIPFWQYGESQERHYFPDSSILSPGSCLDDCLTIAIKGQPWEMGDYGIEWLNTADRQQFRFGFALKQTMKPDQWNALGPAASFDTMVGEAIGMDNTNQPVAGSRLAILDLKIVAFGRRNFVSAG